MKILVLNCGSSSVKYQLLDMENEAVLAKGIVERIGMDDAILTHCPAGRDQYRHVEPIFEHGSAIEVVTRALTDKEHGVIHDIHEIDAVGHRVAHGGEKFTQPALITKDVKQVIEDYFDLAPLHNPPNLKGITATEKVLPNVSQVAVFDTAFHATLPHQAYLYALPYTFYQRYRLRRYGFHGTSHKFVAQQAAKLMGTEITALKIISCHLGNGASIAAIDQGQSVDTSMGFTPLEGLVMGTRCGDLDPAIIPFVMAKEGIKIREVDSMLNKHSGLLGLSGLSSDMRDIAEASGTGDERAQKALDVYAYRVRKYIGAYAAAMDGVDIIIFTAGVGENSPVVRTAVCSRLRYFGVELDEQRNTVQGKAQEITTATSKTKVWVIPTNEELMIARETRDIVTTANQQEKR